MSRKFKGKLIFPDGKARPGVLVIAALTASSNMAAGSSITQPVGSDGSYEVTLEPNIYRVYFADVGANPPGLSIGVAKVLPEGSEQTLLDVIANTAGAHPIDDPYHVQDPRAAPQTIILTSGGFQFPDDPPVSIPIGGGSGYKQKIIGLSYEDKSSKATSDSGEWPYTVTADDDGYTLLAAPPHGATPMLHLPPGDGSMYVGFQFVLTMYSQDDGVTLGQVNVKSGYNKTSQDSFMCVPTEGSENASNGVSLTYGQSAVFTLTESYTGGGDGVEIREWSVVGAFENYVAPESSYTKPAR